MDPEGLSSDASASERRRHSTRFVKRRKFDDELVESSLSKQERARTSSKSQSDFQDLRAAGDSIAVLPVHPPSTRTTRASLALSQSLTKTELTTAINTGGVNLNQTHSEVKQPEKRKTVAKSGGKSKGKKPKVSTQLQVDARKDLGRWKPQDDLMLIEAVQQTNDLKQVHLGVKFSCTFTLKEIEVRWYSLLYDEKISKLAMSAVRQLPFDELVRIQSKALYSRQEEAILNTVTVTSQPTLETFRNLLTTNFSTFHSARTAKSLQDHWTLMKQYHLLPDQTVQPLPKGNHILNFSDAEDMINDNQLVDPIDEAISREVKVNDRRIKKEIRMLEQELPKYQTLVETITGVKQPEFDGQTLAILRGRLVRYLMRSKEITIGRSARDNQVDVDLSLEGPSCKISRRQAMIKLKNNGEFYLFNQGKRPFYVDGKSVAQNSKTKLHNNSVIEITCLRFIFLINQDLIQKLKTDHSTTAPKNTNNQTTNLTAAPTTSTAPANQ